MARSRHRLSGRLEQPANRSRSARVDLPVRQRVRLRLYAEHRRTEHPSRPAPVIANLSSTRRLNPRSTGMTGFPEAVQAATNHRTGLKFKISGPFLIGLLVGVGCRMVVAGPRLGMFAVKMWPRPRTLIASTRPVTTVKPISARTRGV